MKLETGEEKEKQKKSHSARSAWIETTCKEIVVFPPKVALRKECVD